jgi:hypothetical protein
MSIRFSFLAIKWLAFPRVAFRVDVFLCVDIVPDFLAEALPSGIQPTPHPSRSGW